MPESIPDFDLYAMLGVAPGADTETIRAAHREAVRRSHPDVALGDDAGDDATKRLNVARDWLLDPGRRARYDESCGLQSWTTDEGAAVGGRSETPAPEGGIATGLERRDAIGCLEFGGWLLLIVAAGLILATLLLIVADI
jgi:DnaJ-class molecular chaperone